MTQCEICGASVRELRRGRCWGCYSRWVDSRPVGLGASCRMCGERRRGYLKSMELFGSWVALCHNCGARVASIHPLPKTLIELREALARERRAAARKRGWPDDRPLPNERRGEPTPAPPAQVDDEMIIEIAELASELEALGADLPEAGSEVTHIRAVAGLR